MLPAFKSKSTIQNYVEKWLLKINPHKTKVLIFQKQNRKATREKHSFFLSGNQIVNTPEYTYLGTTFNSNGSFATSKKNLVEKSRCSVFACKRYIQFNKLSISKCNFLFDALFAPFFYTVRKYGGHMIAFISKNERKTPLSVFTRSFTNHTLA